MERPNRDNYADINTYDVDLDRYIDHLEETNKELKKAIRFSFPTIRHCGTKELIEKVKQLLNK